MRRCCVGLRVTYLLICREADQKRHDASVSNVEYLPLRKTRKVQRSSVNSVLTKV